MITSADMKKLEEKAELEGISKLVLMDNAGKGISDVLLKQAGSKGLAGKRVLVVAYHGNNGGDGFAAARHLNPITTVHVLFVGNEEKLKDEAKKVHESLKVHYPEIFLDEVKDFDDYDIIIDAIFGLGFKGNIDPELSKVIKQINDSSALIVSADLPSGIDADTGRKANVFVESELIVTFHDTKKGLENLNIDTEIVDIGIPKDE